MTKGYAIKIVNPGGLESWGFGRNVHSIDDQVPNFGITPRDIMCGLAKVNKIGFFIESLFHGRIGKLEIMTQ